MKVLTETVIDDTLLRIREIVGDKGFITEPDAMEPHLVEWRGLWRGQARAVVKPANTAEVSAVVALCAENAIPIVPQGGNTSLVGGSVPYEDFGGIILSLARMNKVRGIDPLNYTMTVEAGCVLAALQRVAEENDRFFPLSLAAEGSCMIGGNRSTNAGGVNVLRYGNTRELVLGLEVVLPDGTVLDGLRSLRKDNTGYDLKHLFVGAEGTLGIITAAVLKLFPKPARRETAMVAITGPDAAIELLARARAATADGVTSFELMPRICFDFVLAHIADTVDPLPQRYDWHVLLELSSTSVTEDGLGEKMQTLLEQAAEDGLVLDAAIAQNQAQALAMWKLRETVSEAQKPEGASIKHDISVPVSRVPDFLRAADA
ncbi:FAD-binding oxidoreductase, partial [Falsiroseomonas sp.]|uniref:FAD-binding oxidoreductase n=1 Tax=Falsiroseomonas sp. TaxID=2870721 RepID=UPI0027200AD5